MPGAGRPAMSNAAIKSSQCSGYFTLGIQLLLVGDDWRILVDKVLISKLSSFSFEPDTGLSMSWGFLG